MLSTVGFGYDASLINGLQANARWSDDLGLNSQTLLGLTVAANSFSAIIAVLPAAWLADNLGRRRTIILGSTIQIATFIAQAFINTGLKLLGTRLVLGMVTTFTNVSSNVLTSELTHPRQRASVTALWFTFFYIGAITVAWTTYGAISIESSWSWRLPTLLQVIWSAVQLPIVFFCPESPRWLMLKGRNAEAKQILATYHANGDLNDELVNLEYQEILTSISTDDNREGNTWLAMVKSGANIKRTVLILFLGLSSQWVGNGIISYYFSPILKSIGITKDTQQQGINGGLQIFSWLMSIIGALLAERSGRRTLLLASAVGMLFCIVGVTICSALYTRTGSADIGKGVIVFLFMFFGSYCIGFTPIPPLYVAEISPSSIRANYVSFYWMAASATLCFNQFVNPIALEAIAWKYYLVYVAVLAVVICVIFLFVPETKGFTLEEVSALFDADLDTTAQLTEKEQGQEMVKEQHYVGYVETVERV
jgi:sugar porter (SP) family MFS transporter